MVENPRKKNTRSKDFRHIYANGIAAQIGGGDATLIFGIREDQSTKDGPIEEEVAVIMTLQTAKVLALSLTKMIESVEKNTGMIIPIDLAPIAELEKLLDAAKPGSSLANPLPSAAMSPS